MSGSTRAVETSGLSLPKWQIALAVGAPVALGLGYWYYRSRKGTTTNKSFDDVEKQAALKQKAVDVETAAAVRSTGEKQNGSASVPATATPVAQVVEEDPYKLAQIHKNKGNKSFKEGKYADAINWYAQAIEICPKTKVQDISTFHQNRAAAYEQLVRDDARYILILHLQLQLESFFFFITEKLCSSDTRLQ